MGAVVNREYLTPGRQVKIKGWYATDGADETPGIVEGEIFVAEDRLFGSEESPLMTEHVNVRLEDGRVRAVPLNFLTVKLTPEESGPALANFMAQWGGPREGAGRKPLQGEPMEAHSVTMPASYWQTVKEAGDGQWSAGIRKIVEWYRDSKSE